MQMSLPHNSLLFRRHLSPFRFRTQRKHEVCLKRCPQTPFHRVDERYQSFSIDISVLAGGHWWEGSHKVRKGLGGARTSAIDLHNEHIDHLVGALGPAFIRLGGSEADTIDYFHPQKDRLCLTEAQWHGLHAFLERHAFQFYFTAKYGVFEHKQHGNWDSRELETLLEHSIKEGMPIDIAELGNELNAYWIFHGLGAQPGPKKLALDYQRFIDVVRNYYPKAKIAGPGSAFWPKLGEPIAPFSNLTRPFLEEMKGKLDIVDWHYYPFQSRRSPVRTRTAHSSAMINPRSFKDFAHYSQLLTLWRNTYQPQAEIWTGESGSAQCGGEAGLSDRFASCFWWADQLGLGAKLGQAVMVRQSLLGGDYALIDRYTCEPRPDFYVSLLWSKLMGPNVHPVHSNDVNLRAYCHADDNKQKVMLLINLDTDEKNIDCQDFGHPTKQFSLTADNLNSQELFLNGVPITESLADLSLQHVPHKNISTLIAPRSINFWVMAK